MSAEGTCRHGALVIQRCRECEEEEETMSAADSLSKDEKSLLLFLETRAVDYGGRVNERHMNADDFAIADRWTGDGFLEFGRIRASDINRDGSHYVRLSRIAQDIASELRRKQTERGWLNRRYRTTTEENQAENAEQEPTP